MTMQGMGSSAFPRPRGAILAVGASIAVVWLFFALAINWLGFGAQLYSSLRLDVAEVLHGQIWRFFTAPFVHEFRSSSAVISLAFQLYALHVFGSALQADWGVKRTAIFLASAALFGEALQVGLDLVLPAPGNGVLHPGVVYGCGAMVTAVLIAWGLTFRDRQMLMLFFPMTGMTLVWVTIGTTVLFLIAAGAPSEGAFAPFGGMAVGYALGASTPSPIRKAFLRWKLRGIERNSTAQKAPGIRPRAAGPNLRVIRGDKDDDSPPPRDKRWLN